MAAQPHPVAPNPMFEAMRQRGGVSVPKRTTQAGRSRSLTYSTGSGGNRRHTIGGIEVPSESQPDAEGPASQEGQGLRWLDLQAFAPKALLGVLDSFKTEDIATSAKELGEQGYSMVQELSRPRQKPKSKPQGQPSKGDGVLRSTLQGRGGIVLPDHLAAHNAARLNQAKEEPAREEVTPSNATAADAVVPDLSAAADAPEALAAAAEGASDVRAQDTPAENAVSAEGGAPTESAAEIKLGKDEALPQADRGSDDATDELEEHETTPLQPAETTPEPSTKQAEEASLASQNFAPPSRPSRPSWVKDDDPPHNFVTLTPSGGSRGGSGTGVRDMRDFWNKKSVGYAGASENGKRRLSKSEAQAALQRLVSAGSAMDFEQVRELRKLAGGAQTDVR